MPRGRSREKFRSPDYVTWPNHAYLKKDTGALGYLFYAYWATSEGPQTSTLPHPSPPTDLRHRHLPSLRPSPPTDLRRRHLPSLCPSPPTDLRRRHLPSLHPSPPTDLRRRHLPSLRFRPTPSTLTKPLPFPTPPHPPTYAFDTYQTSTLPHPLRRGDLNFYHERCAKHPMVRLLYRFHVYYHVRRILKRLQVPLPHEAGFNAADNPYTNEDFSKFVRITKFLTIL